MKRSTLASSAAAFFCLGFAAPLLAAQPAAAGTVNQTSSSEKKVAAVKPAEKCLSDLRAFDNQMDKDGYWLGGSGYGYGYPMAGFGFWPSDDGRDAQKASEWLTRTRGQATSFGPLLPPPTFSPDKANSSRVRTCSPRRAISIKFTWLNMHSGKNADGGPCRAGGSSRSPPRSRSPARILRSRSDELVGTEVRSPQNEALGSVEDLVMSPQTGKIAYLVIARGGIFGIDEKYVPVPWEDFKITPNVKLLVLDTTKGALDTAPQASKDQFATPGHFDQQSQKVDAYWKTHLSDKGKD